MPIYVCVCLCVYQVFDHFGSNLTKETIVHVWKDKSTLNAVVAAGYNALINNSPGDDSWYLDHLNIAWAALYGNEPCETISDPKQCGLILGGQGIMTACLHVAVCDKTTTT